MCAERSCRCCCRCCCCCSCRCCCSCYCWCCTKSEQQQQQQQQQYLQQQQQQQHSLCRSQLCSSWTSARRRRSVPMDGMGPSSAPSATTANWAGAPSGGSSMLPVHTCPSCALHLSQLRLRRHRSALWAAIELPWWGMWIYRNSRRPIAVHTHTCLIITMDLNEPCDSASAYQLVSRREGCPHRHRVL